MPITKHYRMSANNSKRRVLGQCMNKSLLIISLFILSASFTLASESYLNTINQLKWDNRIILVRSSNNLDDILTALKQADDEIIDRHIQWFVFSDDGVYTNYEGNISASFIKATIDKYFPDNESDIILIGKDGGIKKRTNDLNLSAIFDLIDSMPMRQIEMENQ